jgi:Domain of Unknown Function (DUF1206)
VGGTGTDEPLQTARVVTHRAARSLWVERIARYGLVAKGVSYGLVGGLAAAVAVSDTGEATNREGALELVVDESYGAALVVALALGFASYALWRLAQAIFDRGGEGSSATGLVKRAGYLGRAAVYAGLTFVAVQLLDRGSEGGDQGVEEDRLTARVLEWPAGRWLVAAAGLALIGAGLYNGYRAFTQKFEENWNTGDMSPAERRWLPRVSSLGLLSRLVVFSLIGAFLVKAAYGYEPREAIGLDGALRKVVQASYGQALLFVVAAGLPWYALFCLVEARYRRV